MVPEIGVECVCLSGAMLAKAGTVLDVCLGWEESTAVEGNVFTVVLCEFLILFFFFLVFTHHQC